MTTGGMLQEMHYFLQEMKTGNHSREAKLMAAGKMAQKICHFLMEMKIGTKVMSRIDFKCKGCKKHTAFFAGWVTEKELRKKHKDKLCNDCKRRQA